MIPRSLQVSAVVRLFLALWLAITPTFAWAGSMTLLGVGGPALWTPLNLGATLVAWWDAQNVANITLNSSNVSAWADTKSGIIVSQSTGANQPPWSATARNGKAGLTFNGTTQFLASGASPGLPVAATAFSVMVAAFATTSNFDVAIQWGGVGGGGREIGKSNAYFLADGGSASSASAWNGTDQFVEGIADGVSVLSIYVDGGTPVTSAYTPASQTASAVVNIGSRPAGTNLWDGVIQQVLVLNAAPTTSQRQKLEGWESWYDGKAGSNLPGGHPYKSRAPLVTDP